MNKVPWIIITSDVLNNSKIKVLYFHYLFLDKIEASSCHNMVNIL